jgi:hypothetical protein
MATGANGKVAAERLRVSPAMIRNHAQNMFTKLHVPPSPQSGRLRPPAPGAMTRDGREAITGGGAPVSGGRPEGSGLRRDRGRRSCARWREGPRR